MPISAGCLLKRTKEGLRTGLFSSLVHSLGASVGLRDGDLDDCTSCDPNDGSNLAE
jgi:hypothetical protein